MLNPYSDLPHFCIMALGDNELQVVKFAQGLLQDERDVSTITPEVIGGAIDRVVGLNPRWGIGLDRLAATDELIRRFSV